MPLVEGPEARIWVEVTGSGSPVTVIAHGLTSSSTDIAAIATGLAGTRVAFDFRGHGHSDGPAEADYDQTAMARDLAFVADRYGATHAAGVSMGAATILRMLCTDPKRFASVCLLLPAWLDGVAPDRDANARLAQVLETGGTDAVAQQVLASDPVRALIARAPKWERSLRDQIARMETDGMARALRTYPAGAPPVPDPALLARITAPVLVLAHDHDPGHPVEVAHRLGRLLPRAAVRIAAEPLAMLDDMEACGRLIASFFERSFAGIS